MTQRHTGTDVAGFLGRLDPDQLHGLTTLGRARTYPAQSILFFEGDAAHHVLLVLDGHVKVSMTIEGREVVLDVLGRGEILGELSAVDGVARSARASALTTVSVLSVPTGSFTAYLAERPCVAQALLRDLAGRLRDASQRQVEYGALDAVGRVCGRLVELMARYGRAVEAGVEIAGPLTQSDIAAWAGLSREAVVKALQALRRTGCVATTARSITVLDVEAVRSRAALPVA